MKLINLTPHPINIINENCCLEIAPSGITARYHNHPDYLFDVGLDEGINIPVFGTLLETNNSDLPQKEEGVFYIVSIITALLSPERADFLVPNEYIRDENGNIIGCKSLTRISGVI